MARWAWLRNLVIVWLAWAALLVGFQALVSARFAPQRPDHVLAWTASETGPTSQRDKPYLLEPFLNEHVSWDSEYYLSIAVAGYDDPAMRALLLPGARGQTFVPAQGRPLQVASGVGSVSMNYAFFPLYAYTMRGLAAILALLGLNAVATAVLAGVLVSLLGSLAAMLALYDLARDDLGDDGGLRAAFYLLVFPTGFFLAQVYSEGLFLGLAFGALALLRRRYWLAAGALAALAALTRAVGVALVVPMALTWWAEVQAGRGEIGHAGAGSAAGEPPAANAPASGDSAADARFGPGRFQNYRPSRAKGSLAPPDKRESRLLAPTIALLLPLLAFLAWRWSVLGANFQIVEDRFFSRGLFALAQSVFVWGAAWSLIGGPNTQATVYYGLEFGAILLALVACLATLRRYPGPAAYGLLVLAVSFFSGVPQSLARYVLVIPSIFIFLARLGRARAFDRSWTLASTLLMGLLATLFSFDMWVG